jgi:hypothetical protein
MRIIERPMAHNAAVNITPFNISCGSAQGIAGADCIREYAFSKNSNKLDFEPNKRYIRLIN